MRIGLSEVLFEPQRHVREHAGRPQGLPGRTRRGRGKFAGARRPQNQAGEHTQYRDSGKVRRLAAQTEHLSFLLAGFRRGIAGSAGQIRAARGNAVSHSMIDKNCHYFQ
jgi:hypothetical protein